MAGAPPNPTRNLQVPYKEGGLPHIRGRAPRYGPGPAPSRARGDRGPGGLAVAKDICQKGAAPGGGSVSSARAGAFSPRDLLVRSPRGPVPSMAVPAAREQW
ncbi:hypothetical protein Sliba_09870 [Streptomyces nigrescens]|uniref:Uncharacterized protein n=1 Tax=Streptomyces nigrescens TaxID=1920 RepID=A0A640TBI2_STRNI|nr:hypothetical protein Sliba_09870 [Streptomyces libani subsp. libani]GGV87342.1 hypothetical protein GCM10010500_07320 [Streptomyces libani subsp. libani]